MAPWLALLLGCAGGALLARWVWLLRGRTPSTRAWARGTERNVTNVMCGIPTVALGLVGAATSAPAEAGSAVAFAVCATCLVLFAFLGLWGGLQIPVPLWALPRWARCEVARRRAGAKRPQPPRRHGR